ncbi:MAG: ribosomal protein L7/L12 [Candidatus Babeliales bacterium]
MIHIFIFVLKIVAFILLIAGIIGIALFCLGLYFKQEKIEQEKKLQKIYAQPEKKCVVKIISVGPKKIKNIKIIRDYIDLSLIEAKEKIESALPATLYYGMPLELAQEMKANLDEIGTEVEITEL